MQIPRCIQVDVEKTDLRVLRHDIENITGLNVDREKGLPLCKALLVIWRLVLIKTAGQQTPIGFETSGMFSFDLMWELDIAWVLHRDQWVEPD